MAFKTPLHIQSILAPHKRHLIYATVASRAAHPLVHMNAVIEIDEARQIVHSRPLQRLSGAETFAHRFQNRALGPNLGVAIHADLGGWNAGERGLFYRGVAVTAIDAIVIHVVFMTELHRLAARNTDLRHIGGTINRGDKPKQNGQEKNTPEDAHFGDGIRAGMEYLRHCASGFAE